MRLVLMGTGPFGVPSFRKLYDTDHDVVAVVTRPERAAHGRKKAEVSPVRELAVEMGTPILDPESVNTDEARAELEALGADLLIVCDFGQILSAATLATARLGGVNLHGSLLPAYRGAAPINWALYHGETETGVSVIHMTPKVDAGPVIGQASTRVGEDETAPEVEARLSELGAPLVAQAVDALARGDATEIVQDPALVSKAPRLKKTDGLLDWARPAAALRDHVRAMQPWPRAYTFWHRAAGEPLRVVLGPLEAVEGSGEPGEVLEASGERLVVAAGKGACRLTAVQPAGKRMLSAGEFLRGYHPKVGERLGAS
ncbi:MAG: methionyl-tRNA formyltransferase [Planctomycetota bacterium]|nr:methionyl-tRNA formyltransferase [Planctomycetota bacterium]